MKQLIVIICLFIVNSAFAQKKHTECAAPFVGEKMIVDEYSPHGVSKISKNAIGNLTVNTVVLGENTVEKGKAVDYIIAIKDKETETLTIVNTKAKKSLNIKSLIKNTRIGDSLLVILTNEKYALPHHAIEIVE